MKSKKIVISNVMTGSIAEEVGVEAGDILLAINEQKIEDVFDYRFLIANEELLLEIEKPDGEIWEVEIEKDEYEDLGIEFENSMMDEAKSCTNKCIFCFIDQLPKGMRETLYFKDDDSRLSFLMGNYITLTNINNEQIDRIIKYKMSPINVSVHTTNPDLRIFMLKNRFAGDVIGKIKKLVDSGITVNCQIVLCRNVNDSKELDKSISDLTGIYPGVRSISIVPVGITRHREGLCDLEPFDREASSNVIKQVEAWQERLLEQHKSRVVYLADEFYIMADTHIPEYEHYEDFPQIENGVGLIALLKQEFTEYLDELESGSWAMSKSAGKLRHVSIATGVSPYNYIFELAETLMSKYQNLKVNVFEIKNNFFGENVTVTGLLTGSDLVSQLAGKELGTELLISRSMLKSGETLFLDDYTVDMLEKQLNIKVSIVENSGKDFVNKVLGII
ncbi:MAG: DUF512 domain-containing protein [Clostridia bacterium]|nr:DUF512 domain-containing protein [Clostridia bacterium]